MTHNPSLGHSGRLGRIVEVIETDGGAEFVIEFDSPEKRKQAEEMVAAFNGYFLAIDDILTDEWLDAPE